MRVVGYYNANRYEIVGITDDPKADYIQLYSAGNSPVDSQTYLSAENGVGLRKMRSYCIQTTKEIAKENNAKYGGVERDTNEEAI